MRLAANLPFKGVSIRPLSFVRFTAQRLGLLGWLGFALLVGALLYALVLVPQYRNESAVLESQIEQLRVARIELGRRGAGEGEGKADISAMKLPQVREVPQIIASLEAMAKQEGLTIQRNDYRYVDSPSVATRGVAGKANAEPDHRLLEVRITTPASGSYVSLRAYLARALQKYPTLALDDFVLKRETIANGSLQAQLHFTLFVSSAP